MRFLAFAAVMFPAAAYADTLSGTKAIEMYDRGHTIEVRIEPGHATLTVTRIFENRSAKHDQAMLHMTDLPLGAVATGMRTLGDKWFVAELLDAELAAKKYRELTGIGGYYPKDPALLSWRSQGHLALQVFPVAPKSQKTVEITLQMPTVWAKGRHEIVIPKMGTDALPPNLVVKGEHLSIGGTDVKNGDLRRLFGETTLAMAPVDPPKLGGRFASIGFVKGKAVVHAAIEIAPKLSDVPKGAYVVVVIDGSRSTDKERTMQLGATRAYLEQMPDAKVQVLVFDRKVRALNSDFVPVKQALDELKLGPGKNGSNIELALAEAGKRIVAAPNGAPRRIVAITDFATRSTLLPSQVKGLDATKAVVHLATVANGAPSVSRDDYEPWATVARSTGGLLFRTVVGTDNAKNKPALEEWVRPLRIDCLSITGVGMKAGVIDIPDTLAEGEGFDQAVIDAFPTPSIEVKGELWSSPISAVFASSPSEEKLWAGLTIGSDLLSQLKDPEIATLAFKGGVVSPMTSYLAIEPGVRPSTEGLEWGEGGIGFGGMGLGGGGSGTGIGLGKIGIDRQKLLRDRLAEVAKYCGLASAKVHLETTWTEIVEVKSTSACVTDWFYEVELPSAFDTRWAAWDVTTDS